MENENDKTKAPLIDFVNINQVEGAKDFFNVALDEKVYHYLRKKDLLGNKENELYRLYISIRAGADDLPNIFLDDQLTHNQKNQKLNNSVNAMIEKLENLTAAITPETAISPKSTNHVKKD